MWSRGHICVKNWLEYSVLIIVLQATMTVEGLGGISALAIRRPSNLMPHTLIH